MIIFSSKNGDKIISGLLHSDKSRSKSRKKFGQFLTRNFVSTQRTADKTLEELIQISANPLARRRTIETF